MKNRFEGLWILLLALALLIAMVLTLWLGGEKSRHGYGSLPCTQGVPVMTG